MTEDAATRLGRLIRERRKQLNLTQADIQAAGGPSTATLRLIEGGKHTDFRPSTSQPLEKVLHWHPGSIAAILKGGGPSVSGVIRGQAGRPIETFRAIEGSEQENLRRLRLAAIIMDARDLVVSQSGPLMTALASLLDEASDLVVAVLAEEEGEDGIVNARWRINQVRAGNSIRRQGDVYVADYDDSDNVRALRSAAGSGDDYDSPPPQELADAARAAPAAYEKGRSEQGDADAEESQDQGDGKHS